MSVSTSVRARLPNIATRGSAQSINVSFGAHCPVPVYFCFDALTVLAQDDMEFSNGNMGSPRASHSGERDFFLSIPFHLVFHNRWFAPDERDEYREAGDGSERTWEGKKETLNNLLHIRVRGAVWGIVTLHLDDALAFADMLIFEELPF